MSDLVLCYNSQIAEPSSGKQVSIPHKRHPSVLWRVEMKASLVLCSFYADSQQLVLTKITPYY